MSSCLVAGSSVPAAAQKSDLEQWRTMMSGEDRLEGKRGGSPASFVVVVDEELRKQRPILHDEN
jgi:hypothetical protein